jgi:hypothetical protein
MKASKAFDSALVRFTLWPSISGGFHMRRLLLALPFLAFAAQAEEPAIITTIENQFAAFQRDDFLTAFSYASPTIRSVFQNSENFGMMVKRGYPMVHRPANVQMLDQREEPGFVLQRVLVTDQTGRSFLLAYEMVQAGDRWLIDAVHLLEQSQAGA